jgi:hypothetical protein
MEETKKIKEPVYVERPDKTIVRMKHPRLEIRVLDADCTRKQLEHALSMVYEWVRHGKGIENKEEQK